MSEFRGRPSTEAAIQLLREGRVHECIDCIDQIIQAYPDDALAYSILGAAYSQAGDHGMAIAAFEKSLAWSDTAQSHFNLGRAYERAGRVKDALREYEVAARMEPTYQQAAQGMERVSELLARAAAEADELYKPHLLGRDDGAA